MHTSVFKHFQNIIELWITTCALEPSEVTCKVLFRRRLLQKNEIFFHRFYLKYNRKIRYYIGLTNLKLQQVHTGGIVQDTHISYY